MQKNVWFTFSERIFISVTASVLMRLKRKIAAQVKGEDKIAIKTKKKKMIKIFYLVKIILSI